MMVVAAAERQANIERRGRACDALGNISSDGRRALRRSRPSLATQLKHPNTLGRRSVRASWSPNHDLPTSRR